MSSLGTSVRRWWQVAAACVPAAFGHLQQARRDIKFRVRSAWHAGASAIADSVFRSPVLRGVAESLPELRYRPLRSYLRRGLRATERAFALRAHFEWLVKSLAPSLIERLYSGGQVPLLDGEAASLDGLEISMAIAGGLGREGELALLLQWQGQTVMMLAFSVVAALHVLDRRDRPASAQARIVVGALQGVRGAHDGLRELSRAAQRIRPSALLVLATQALAQAWRLAPTLAVASRSHVYAGYASRRRKVSLDYDATWAEAGAVRMGRDYWVLPEQPLWRPDAEVESKHRAQHRRRNELRRRVFAAVRDAAMKLDAAQAAAPAEAVEDRREAAAAVPATARALPAPWPVDHGH